MRSPLVAALTFVAACAPIPVNKTFVMWPGRTIRVVDGETQKPIEGATIRLVRYEHPHRRDDEVKKLKTGANGELTIERETKSLRTFPLMMHGVPGFSYEACAETEGRAAVSAILRDGESGLLTLALPVGSRPCRGDADNTPPVAGRLRVEGVEKEGARFLVSLAMEQGHKVKKGDALGLLIIEEVVFLSEGGTLSRARVAVSGDATTLRHGDLIAAP